MIVARRRPWIPLASVSLALLLLGSLSGCAGIVAVVRGSSEFRLEQPELWSPHRGVPTRAEHFVRTFGEPDEIVAAGPDRELWRYRTGLRLHGIAVLLVVVPLPLLVPTGVHQTWVEVERGTVVGVRGSQNSDVARVGCMIGAFASMAVGDRGCFAKRGAAPKRAVLGSDVIWLGPAPSLRRAPPRAAGG